MTPRVFGVRIECGDGHESDDLEAGEGEEGFEGAFTFIRRESKLRAVVGDIHLEVDLGMEPEFGGDAIDLGGEIDGIDAVDRL